MISLYPLTFKDYVEYRRRPRVRVTRYVSSIGRHRRWRLSKVSYTSNLRAMEIDRSFKSQLWNNRRLIGCWGDDVISNVVTCNRVEPSHDWRPVAAVRNTTRHRDDVILLYGSRRWQVRGTVNDSCTPIIKQESPANAKVSVRQQCVYEGPLVKKSTANEPKEHNVEKYIQSLTTLSLTILDYLHSFSCCCVRDLRNSLKTWTYKVQDHPRSSILVSIESAYATSY